MGEGSAAWRRLDRSQSGGRLSEEDPKPPRQSQGGRVSNGRALGRSYLPPVMIFYLNTKANIERLKNISGLALAGLAQ